MFHSRRSIRAYAKFICCFKVNSGPPKRPSILPDTFKKPTEEKLFGSCSPKPSKHDIIRESIAEELDTFLPYEKFAGSRSSAVTFSFSTLERCNKLVSCFCDQKWF